MNVRRKFFVIAAVAGVLGRFSAFAGGYHLERVSPPLNQPTYLTQAPGDPANIIYYCTRITSTLSGFNPSPANTMGQVWRYDLNTRTSTSVLNLSARRVHNDDGLQIIAFHPDFNNTNTFGFGKLYVSSAEYIGPTSTPDNYVVPVNRVEEYFLNPTNIGLGAVFSRLILQYTNNAQNNHTVGWIGFNTFDTNTERHFLYISTGDSSYENAYNSGVSPSGRPSQNPFDVKGKILRVDISGGDDYPADSLKNFSIPLSNPIPVYNTNHPGTSLTNALGEVYITGIRNAYRVSFDRANGDMYWGDVGENTYEEVDFLKYGSNTFGPPVDYGWPQHEGVHYSGITNAPNTPTNPFTGVISLNPIQEYLHSAGRAAIGGYVYRGPIPELQGKYFYSDFVTGKVWMLDFNRNTDPTTFNATNGTVTDITSLWSSLIIDTNVATYRGDTSITVSNGLDHVVSLGEDNEGNLYLVDFGFGSGFSGQYMVNCGEIFKVVPNPTLIMTNTGLSVQLSWPVGYKLQSQTNTASTGIRTNWVDYPGSGTAVTLSVQTTLNTVFFRLTAKP